MPDGLGPSGRIALGEFTVDFADERMWGPSGQVRLGNKAFSFLSRLVADAGRLVTKDSLFSSVWDGTIVSESALTSVVKELRRALGDDPRQPRYIQSVYGRGYRLVAAVQVAEPTSREFEPRVVTTRPPIVVRDATSGQPPLLYVPSFEVREDYPALGDVIREEVLLALSRFRDIRLVSDAAAVRAPSLSNSFAERDYQLDIRLSSQGDSISVFARISRLQTREIIWADREQFDPAAPMKDVEPLIRKIAAAALPRVHDDVVNHLPAQTNDNYGIYLLNKLAMRTADNLADMQVVARAWEALLQAQPNFAPAYAPLIRLYNTDFGYTGLGTTTDAERSKAYALARKAVRLDPSEPYLQTVSAWCHLWAGETDSARDHLEQALALNPFQRDRLLEIATALMFLGDLDQAAELLARCETLTPFPTAAPHEEAGLLHLLLGQYDKARHCLGRITYPTTSSALYALLAAGASAAPDFSLQVEHWVQQTCRRWHGSSEPDAEVLGDWIIYHHPFSEEGTREWISELLSQPIKSALLALNHSPSQAPSTGSFEPSAEPVPS